MNKKVVQRLNTKFTQLLNTKFVQRLNKKCVQFWKRRHKYLIRFWIVMGIPTVLWWHDSVLWVLIMSLYANIESSAAAWNAQKQQRKDEESGK